MELSTIFDSIPMRFLLLISALILTLPTPICAQYEENIAKLEEYFQEEDPISTDLVLRYWLDNPQYFPNGVDVYISYVHMLALDSSIHEPTFKEEEFVNALTGGVRVTHRPKSLSRGKKVLAGYVIGWSEKDSLVVYSGFGYESVSVIPKSSFVAFQAFRALSAFGAEVVFQVSEGNMIYYFGLANDRVWVTKAKPDNTFDVLEWDEFVNCCYENFWEMSFLHFGR